MRTFNTQAQALSNKPNRIEIGRIEGREAFLVNCGRSALISSALIRTLLFNESINNQNV